MGLCCGIAVFAVDRLTPDATYFTISFHDYVKQFFGSVKGDRNYCNLVNNFSLEVKIPRLDSGIF